MTPSKESYAAAFLGGVILKRQRLPESERVHYTMVNAAQIMEAMIIVKGALCPR